MEYIMKKFRNRKGTSIDNIRKSAVMILLLEENDEVYLILEKRALSLRKQPGDISLPGGGIEEGETPKKAAIRETYEELNINEENFQFIGEMDYLITSFNSIIYTFVGKIKEDKMLPNKSEVDHVIKVPLKFFIESKPEAHEVLIKQHFKENFPFEIINGGKKYKFSEKKYTQYFYRYNDYVIWGFTATIIKRFIDLIK